MRQARILPRALLFCGIVCFIFGATAISQRVSAQGYYQCPYGYYYVPYYGCAPLSYLYGYPYYGYPYYGYPYFGFDFFYGGGWGGRGWGGYGHGWGGYGYRGGPRGGAPHGSVHGHGR